jgi:hypothetical protein
VALGFKITREILVMWDQLTDICIRILLFSVSESLVMELDVLYHCYHFNENLIVIKQDHGAREKTRVILK